MSNKQPYIIGTYLDNNSLIIQMSHMSLNYKYCTYRLLKNKIIVSRKSLLDKSCRFVVNQNGLYKINVTMCDENNNIFSIDTEVIDVSLKVYEKNILMSYLEVNKDFNKIMLNVANFINYVYNIKTCSLLIDDITVTEYTNSFEVASFKISQTGLYQLKIIYENFDSSIDEIILPINIEYKNTHSSKIDQDNIRISMVNNFLIFDILYAFILREFQRKYDKGYLRYFSIVLGPAVQIGILVTIFTLMGRSSNAGLGIPLFVITGILPYTFFTSAGNCLTVVSGNRSLLSYRQVKIIDIIMSNVLMELLVVFVVFCGGLILCWYLGVNVVIYNPLSLILSFILLLIITFGLSMILAVIGFYFAEFNYAIQVVFRALFYISGVFFSVKNIPVQYQKYVLWNPLLQIIEFIRFSFVSFNLPHELSYLYLFKCTLAIFLLGLAMYFVNRNKFMINDRAR